MKEELLTKRTLLIKIQDKKDENAWEEFVNYYEDFIKKILLYLKLNANETDDVLQDILLKIWKSIQNFDYNPEKAKFRTWLNTVIRNCLYDYSRKKKSNLKTSNLDDLEANFSNDEHKKFEDMIEREWKIHITNLALKNLEKVFTGHALQVFKDSLEGLSVKDIATKYELNEKSVYVLKNRVEKKLIKEVSLLKSEIEL